MTATASTLEAGPIPQGDLRLLDTDVAQRLLGSTIPARLAYVATDGTPRVVPTWFEWIAERLPSPLGGVQGVAS